MSKIQGFPAETSNLEQFWAQFLIKVDADSLSSCSQLFLCCFDFLSSILTVFSDRERVLSKLAIASTGKFWGCSRIFLKSTSGFSSSLGAFPCCFPPIVSPLNFPLAPFELFYQQLLRKPQSFCRNLCESFA